MVIVDIYTLIAVQNILNRRLILRNIYSYQLDRWTTASGQSQNLLSDLHEHNIIQSELISAALRCTKIQWQLQGSHHKCRVAVLGKVSSVQI